MERVPGSVELLNRPIRAVEPAHYAASASSGHDVHLRAQDAAGDPGVQFSHRLSAALGSYFAAETEAQETISVGQIALRGLGSVRDTLVQMKVLSLRASAEPISPGERLRLIDQFRLLVQDLHEALEATRWRGQAVLTGAQPPRELTVGGHSLVIALPRVESVRLRAALDHLSARPSAELARALAEAVGQTLEQVERDERALGEAVEFIQASYSSSI